MVNLERQIHEILHPRIEFNYADFCAAKGIDRTARMPHTTWRNAKCDVQVAWSHIWYETDFLVSNDKNFVKKTKLPRLVALGAKGILRPSSLSEIWAAA
jgi:hypothetical protein